jgi:hypothetical protein
VDNEPPTDPALDLLPSDVALELLRELTSTFGRRVLRASEMLTESQRHHIVHGHPLSFGCCASEKES